MPDASLENEPGFLFDALVLPDGERGVRELAKDGHTLELSKDQYRHCKPIMVMTASTVLMHMAQIPPLLPSGNEDPGIVVGIDDSAIAQFVSAIARHRHPERENRSPCCVADSLFYICPETVRSPALPEHIMSKTNTPNSSAQRRAGFNAGHLQCLLRRQVPNTDAFDHFASKVTRWAGSPVAFCIALACVLVWAAAGTSVLFFGVLATGD